MQGRRTAGPRHGPALVGGSRSFAAFLLPDGYSPDPSRMVCRCVGFTAAARKLPREPSAAPARLRGTGINAAALVLYGTLALRSNGVSQTRCFWTEWKQEVGSAFQTSQTRGSSKQYLQGRFPVFCSRTEPLRRADSVTLYSTMRVGLGV